MTNDADYADLEIGLHRREADSYAIELRFSHPKSEADIRLMRDGQAVAHFDVEKLRSLALEAAAYGQTLGQCLFADVAVKTAFAQARASAQTLNVPLRLRLIIGPSAPELHSLRWETLYDPEENNVPLFTSENIFFSRYLSSLDWRPVRLRPRGELRALAAVASPTNLATYKQLAPVDVEGELGRAKSGLGSIPMTSFPASGSPDRATLKNLVEHLREGYDIFYLACHGTFKEDKSAWLLLEDEAGNADWVSGSDLVTRLREMQQPPRLVVLVSCQSAGTGTDTRPGQAGPLAALGPRLAEAGVPAVLAMQGDVSMQTSAEFMPVFFQELQRDGQIDRAMAIARGAVRERPDYWAPALFMRLKSGRLWYVPGFADDQQGLKTWPALRDNIQEKTCTPILGPGLLEAMFGSRREIARGWAEKLAVPMASYSREDLPQVAQYLAVDQDYMYPRRQLGNYLLQELIKRYGHEVGGASLGQLSLPELMTAVGAYQRERNPLEPHKVLAGLPLPIYITANPDNLLTEALSAAGKKPQVEICRWNNFTAQLPSIYDTEPDYRPTPLRPLVYHLFGHLGELRSMVLTEDDYFDYLLGVIRNINRIPKVVRSALANTALLFLGFQIDDWNFRVIFRTIMGQEGSDQLKDYAHVTVQIAPEEGRILDPARARLYLERYFIKSTIANTGIFWGNVEDFVQQLQRQWTGGNA